jgi:Domain of unknown function (DUF4190)
MTNPGEDAGQTASSDSSGGGSEPSSTANEAPSIEQSDDTPAEPGRAEALLQAEQPAYDSPPAYNPPSTGYAPGYQQPQNYPNFPTPDYTQPTEYPAQGGQQPGYPPPYPGPPGYGAPSYPAPAQYGAPQYGTPPGYPPPPPGYAAPPPGYGPPPTGYPGPDYSAYGPPVQKTNQMAIASLVASIIGLVFGFFLMFLCFIGFAPPLIGIVLGVVALNQIKRSGEQGRGFAIAGIIIGGVAFVPLIIGLILYSANAVSF